MKRIVLAMFFVITTVVSFAQDSTTEAPPVNKGFKKQNLFTGGGVDFSLSTYYTVLGISPVLGYSITKWLDAGIVANFIYSSDRLYDYNGYPTGEKIRQIDYGPGAFFRVYPIDFLFVQGQFEENFIKYIDLPAGGGPSYSVKLNAPSFLAGAGYCTGREGGSGDPFFYLSIMFDVIGNKNSPYVQQNGDGSTSVIPIIRGGIQVPLFQGARGHTRRHHNNRDDY